MGAFFAFLVRRWVVAILVVLAVASATLGYIQQGQQIWEYGPPAWAFELAGFILFVAVVTYLLFEWDQKVRSLSPGDVEHARADEDRKRKRELIDKSRDFAAIYTQGRTGQDSFRQYLEGTKTYAALRGHLSKEYLKKLNDGRTVYAQTPGARYEPLVEMFLDDLDRLEREWGL